jgi:hypothetical protein
MSLGVDIKHESVWRAIPFTEKTIGDKLSSTMNFSSVLPLTPSHVSSSSSKPTNRSITAASYVAAARARSTSSSAARKERDERAAYEALQWPPRRPSHPPPPPPQSNNRNSRNMGLGKGGYNYEEASDADRELYKAVFSTMKRRDVSADKIAYNNDNNTSSLLDDPQKSSFRNKNDVPMTTNDKTSSNSHANSRVRSIPYGAETARARAIEEAILSSTPLPYQRQRALVDAEITKLGSPPNKNGNRVLRPPTTIDVRPPSAERSSSNGRGYVLPEFPPSTSIRSVAEISTQTHPDDATAILKISGSPLTKSQHKCSPLQSESDHLSERPPFDLHLTGAGSRRKSGACMHEVGRKQSNEKTLAGMHRTGGGYTGVVRARGVSGRDATQHHSLEKDAIPARGRAAVVTYSIPPLVHPRYLPSPLTPPLAPPPPPPPPPLPPPPPPPVVETQKKVEQVETRMKVEQVKTQKKDDLVDSNDSDERISLPQLVVFMKAFGEELAVRMGEAAAAAVEMSAAEQAAIGKAASEAMASDDLLISLLMQEREDTVCEKREEDTVSEKREEDTGKALEKENTSFLPLKLSSKNVSVRPLSSTVIRSSSTLTSVKPPLVSSSSTTTIRRPMVAPLGPSARQQQKKYQETLSAFQQDMKKADKIARDISRRASEVSEEAVMLAMLSSMQGAGSGNISGGVSTLSSVLDNVMTSS